MSTCLQSQEVSDHRIHRESRREKDRPPEQNSEQEKKIGKRRKGTKAGALRRTLVFFGNFGWEIQTWESTSFGAKLG